MKINEYIFSVIIPTYNRADALERCLNSLVDQTFKEFEVIVCDDGSIDHTEEIVSRFEHQLTISYRCEENWGGPARPRNRGILLARGEYICFLDSDDWWRPQKLEVVKNNLSVNADVYYHSLTITNGNKQFGNIRCRAVDNSNPGIDLLTNLNTLPTSSVCIRKSLLINNKFSEDKDLIALEDYDLWIRLGLVGSKFFWIKTVLGYYFVEGTDNITLIGEKQINKYNTLYRQYLGNSNYKLKPIEAALNFHIGRIRQDSKLRGFASFYFKSFLYGTLRIKLMILNRVKRVVL